MILAFHLLSENDGGIMSLLEQRGDGCLVLFQVRRIIHESDRMMTESAYPVALRTLLFMFLEFGWVFAIRAELAILVLMRCPEMILELLDAEYLVAHTAQPVARTIVPAVRLFILGEDDLLAVFPPAEQDPVRTLRSEMPVEIVLRARESAAVRGMDARVFLAVHRHEQEILGVRRIGIQQAWFRRRRADETFALRDALVFWFVQFQVRPRAREAHADGIVAGLFRGRGGAIETDETDRDADRLMADEAVDIDLHD